MACVSRAPGGHGSGLNRAPVDVDRLPGDGLAGDAEPDGVGYLPGRDLSGPIGCLASSAETAGQPAVRPVFCTMFPTVASVIGVSTKPRHTAFTVTPVQASSAETARTSPRTPCLLAV